MPRPSTDALWEGFARECPEHFILTEDGFSGDHVDAERFFALGERDAALILAQVRPWLGSVDMVVEIGCGVGRLSIPMAARFQRVLAIDVSATMLARCAENCVSRGVQNVVPLQASDAAEQDIAADLVFSHLVLQHIEDFEAIRRYAALTRRWLRSDGVASLQFDTRPRSLGYRVARHFPDALLPRTRRRGIRRVRRSRDELITTLREVQLDVVAEIAPATERHVLIATHLEARR